MTAVAIRGDANSDTTSVATLRGALVEAGYMPLAVYSPGARFPCRHPGKQPALPSWPECARSGKGLEPKTNALNTGVLCDGLRAVDLDIDDAGICERVEELARATLGAAPTRWRENSPRVLLVYRAADGEPAKRAISGTQGKIEVLGKGQQFVAYGGHPSGSMLSWRDGDLVDTLRDDLPAITEDQISDFLSQAGEIIGTEAPAKDAPPAPRVERIDAPGGDFFANVNRRALECLSLWVQQIFPSAKFQAATGAYRISSRDLGRDLEEDLSIAPNGVKDWGVHDMGDARDGSRTAIDIVIEHGGAADARQAAFWLCERMGTTPDNMGWTGFEAAPDDGYDASVLLKSGERDEVGQGEQKERGKLAWVGDPATEYDHQPELVRETIPKVGVGFLGGQSGAWKSFLAVEIGVSINTGNPFVGRIIEETGAVLYVAFEGASTIPGRIKARRSLLSDPELRLPFFVLSNFGSVFTNADFEAFANRIYGLASEIERRHAVPLRLVIIDTVAASGMIGMDRENDPAAWQRVFDFYNAVATELRLAVVLVHHYGKDANAGLRGSSNARAGADFVMAMTCDRDEITGDTSNHFLALTKSRDGIEGGMAAVSASEVQIATRPDGSAINSLVLQFDPATKLRTARKPSRAAQCLESAFSAAMAGNSERVHVHGDRNSSSMLAVRLEHVRREFEAIYVTGVSDPKKRADLIRKQFSNALKSPPAGIMAGAWDGAEWLWTLNGMSE